MDRGVAGPGSGLRERALRMGLFPLGEQHLPIYCSFLRQHLWPSLTTIHT